MKIATVIGTRPNLIKVSALSNEIRKNHTEVLIDTGQHYDSNMAGDFYKDLKIPKPDFNLHIGSASHAKQTSLIMIPLEEMLDNINPDFVLVHGDTNSTLAGALCASKLNIPVVHVEAGLRSYDRRMPEEINRIIVDHISSVCCCPTITAYNNLEREGVDYGYGYYTIYTGDIMLDMVNKYLEHSLKMTKIIDYLSLETVEYYLTTIHRVSNTDNKDNLKNILNNLGKLKHRVIFPAHPRTSQRIASYGLSLPENITMIEPVSYFEMLTLIKCATKVITDSGGVQKESYFIGTPCITLRDTTEWVETNAGYWNICVGKNFDLIQSSVHIIPDKERINLNCFGDGNASHNVIKSIEYYYDLMEEWK